MQIDIFNDRYEHAGTADKRDAHTRGLWHRTFTALVIDPGRQTVLLQKKAPGRVPFPRPDYADITVGGHYHAGEEIPDGVREAREELGIRDLSYADFVPLGVRQTAVTIAPGYIEREFQHIHLLPRDDALGTIPLGGDGEVSGLAEISLDDAICLSAGGTARVPARYLTRDRTGLTVTSGFLGTADLIPGYLAIDRLYLRLFVASRRFIGGDREHLYW